MSLFQNSSLRTSTMLLVSAAASAGLTGCQADRDNESAPASYTKIDENTYEFRGYDFPRGLGQFRSEVPGDFMIQYGQPSQPFRGDILAIRKTVESAGGVSNTVTFPETYGEQ